MTKLFYKETEIEVDDSQRIIEINPDLPEEYFKVGDLIGFSTIPNYIVTKVVSVHPKGYLKDGKLDISYDIYNILFGHTYKNLAHKSIKKLIKFGECKNGNKNM